MKLVRIGFLLWMLLSLWQCKQPVEKPPYRSMQVGMVPASFPVKFALLTQQGRQYVAFYDTSHAMVLASRKLEQANWEYQKLESTIGWDSHNYLSLALDRDGYIHLAGNMHSSALVYFRSDEPYNIKSMKALHRMVSKEEDVTTYPEFMFAPDSSLVFHYRYGISGNGYEVYNKYDELSQTWQRLLDKPLTDGLGQMNAYMQGPSLGADGFYHLIWVWRNTPDCSTNHTLSHARSRDLVHWESVSGKAVALPMTINEQELYVDTTPERMGLINIGIQIGFDCDNQLLIGYHKYDGTGNTQLFVARYTPSGWQSQQVTQWDYRWDFKGYGTIKNELLIDDPVCLEDTLVFGYHHTKYGDGQVLIDGESLRPIGNRAYRSSYPVELDSVRASLAGMVVNKVFAPSYSDDRMKYLLRWETLPPNRDMERTGTLPDAANLQLIELVR